MRMRDFFFLFLIFLKNDRATFCHIAGVNCRERGATSIFFFALLLYSRISVACSLRDRLPQIVMAVIWQLRVADYAKETRAFVSLSATAGKALRVLPARPHLPRMTQSGAKCLYSFILVVCPTQTIPSRSPTSPCRSALFNPTGVAAPRCTVFARE
jgi:hypothetical protein